MGDYFQILRPATQDTTKFKTLRPAYYAQKLRGAIILPAFSFTGLTWKGASQLIVQFNISLPSSFTIPVLPSGVGRNFCLCIRHRVGTTPYRWKLWEGVGEILYPPTLYTSGIVKPNFTLEVWSTAASSSTSLATALVIPTSLLYVPTLPTDISPLIIGVGSQRIPYQFGGIQPVATNILDYLANNT